MPSVGWAWLGAPVDALGGKAIPGLYWPNSTTVPGLGPSKQCGRGRQSGPGRLNSPVVLCETERPNSGSAGGDEHLILCSPQGGAHCPSEDLGSIWVPENGSMASPSTGHQNYLKACASMCKHVSVCIHVCSVSRSCCIYSNNFDYTKYMQQNVPFNHSAQFGSIKSRHILKPSPLSIFRTFHLPKLKLCPHRYPGIP